VVGARLLAEDAAAGRGEHSDDGRVGYQVAVVLPRPGARQSPAIELSQLLEGGPHGGRRPPQHGHEVVVVHNRRYVAGPCPSAPRPKPTWTPSTPSSASWPSTSSWAPRPSPPLPTCAATSSVPTRRRGS